MPSIILENAQKKLRLVTRYAQSSAAEIASLVDLGDQSIHLLTDIERPRRWAVVSARMLAIVMAYGQTRVNLPGAYGARVTQPSI